MRVSWTEPRQFITVDLNGWLDHLVGIRVSKSKTLLEPRTLGFRSTILKHQTVNNDSEQNCPWLFGAQALASARYSMKNDPLVDAFDALLDESYFQMRDNHISPLPVFKALWRLVAEEMKRSECSADLALVIPDTPQLGNQAIVQKTGRTRLETLYHELEKARPSALASSRIELVWRSVATVEVASAKGRIPKEEGAIFVININRQTSWTVIDLVDWAWDNRTPKSLCIARSATMDKCEDTQSLTARRMSAVQSYFSEKKFDFKKILKWTRLAEIIASDMTETTAMELGIDIDALEHRSGPLREGDWALLSKRPRVGFETTILPSKLKERLHEFQRNHRQKPLAIIVECPAGEELIADFCSSIQQELIEDIPVRQVTGTETVQAARQLATRLRQNRTEPPAWLDVIPEIELKLQSQEWSPIIPSGEVIPAGETYRSPIDNKRWVTLAPGIEQVHLNIRRGWENNWDERYSGKHTGHTIRPSDNVRIVQPQIMVRPLSGDARLEIIEGPSTQEKQPLIGSKASIRWSEMASEPPPALRSIPDLYIFKPSEQGWYSLESLLNQLVDNSDSMDLIDRVTIRNDIYVCVRELWRIGFPLGSDALPSREIYGRDPTQFENAKQLIKQAIPILLKDLKNYVENCLDYVGQFNDGQTNRLHLPLTWMFTACPKEAVDILLDAIIDSDGQTAQALRMQQQFSAWAVYSGVGRAALSEGALVGIFDDLIGKWSSEDKSRQDKFLLAAVTHPMARRVAVRYVLNDEERFNRVREFLNCQLRNLLDGNNDPRVGINPALELRYITMGYRGLCQVRYATDDWLSIHAPYAQWVHDRLLDALPMGNDFSQQLVLRTAPYLIGQGQDPTMPGGF